MRQLSALGIGALCLITSELGAQSIIRPLGCPLAVVDSLPPATDSTNAAADSASSPARPPQIRWGAMPPGRPPAGSFRAHFVLDAKGKPEPCSIWIEGEGSDDQRSAVLYVVRHSRYRAGIVDGKPTRVWMTVPIVLTGQ